jgi:outer membrane protein assembly factor BamA
VSGARIAGIRFTGNMGFPENDLRRQLRVTDGDRFAFIEWQADRERLIAFYQSRGFFEVRVRARRLLSTGETLDSVSSDTTIESITLEYDIERGRPTHLEISGFSVPDRTRQLIIKRWSSAVFDGFLERDATLIVREYLYAENRLQATVASTIERNAADDSKTLRVAIEAGRVTRRSLAFEGNAAFSTAALLDIAERTAPLAPWLDPASFALMVARLYHDEGLLSAEVNVQPPQIQQDVSVVRVVIREGDDWTLGGISVDGGAALGDGNLFDTTSLVDGRRYSPRAIAERVANLEQRFRDAGFLSAHVTAEHSLDPSAHRVNVHVIAEPGPRTLLTSVSVEGSAADRAAVARNTSLQAGTPVSASELSSTRRRLYETGAYRSVDIELEPLAEDAPQGVPINPMLGDRRVVARIHVEQRPRYSFRYGLAVNDDVTGPDQRSREIGLAADFENKNVLGLGATLGLSARLRRDQEVGRVYLGMPRFFDLPLQSTLFLSRGKQNVGSDGPNKTVSDVTEISAQQTYRLRRLATVSYGYSLGRNRTTLEALGIDLTVRVARLNGNAIIERRNDPFNPTRGWFTSANFEMSRPGLGSQLSFLRTFLQQFQFVPLGPGIVFASAARVGLARTYRAETLIPSERFFAGGATSVRGYADDALGARSVLGDADGGAASLIANSEIRFPIYRWLRGVGYLDLGNVYPTVYDLLHTGVQVGTGAGFRLNTPVGLLRLDFGAPVNPRPLDPAWTVHFGLGHAF